MKRLLSTIFLVLFLISGNSFEYRNLTDAEEASLRTAASKAAGIEVWQIQGNVIRVETGDTALVSVLFQPADISGYCLAPAAFFSAESPASELTDWSLIEGGTMQYRFWYQPCDVADPQSPIVLEQYVDTSILERLKTQKNQIVGDAVRLLSSDHEYNVPISEHQLRGASIHFDTDRGAVYKLSYWGTNCRGISIDVVLKPDEIGVIRSGIWIC